MCTTRFKSDFSFYPRILPLCVSMVTNTFELRWRERLPWYSRPTSGCQCSGLRFAVREIIVDCGLLSSRVLRIRTFWISFPAVSMRLQLWLYVCILIPCLLFTNVTHGNRDTAHVACRCEVVSIFCLSTKLCRLMCDSRLHELGVQDEWGKTRDKKNPCLRILGKKILFRIAFQESKILAIRSCFFSTLIDVKKCKYSEFIRKVRFILKEWDVRMRA